MSSIVIFLLGAFLGGLVVWYLQQQRHLILKSKSDFEIEAKSRELTLLSQKQEQMVEEFKNIAAKSLKDSNQDFFNLAKNFFDSSERQRQQQSRMQQQLHEQTLGTLFDGVRSVIQGVDNKISELEKARVGAYQALNEQIKNLNDAQFRLQSETANLSKALKSPNTRGRWGEIQLKRVVEMAGMLAYCDFSEQTSFNNSEDELKTQSLRPDLVVQLPSNRLIVIDAKTPIESYLKSLEENDESKVQTYLREYAVHVRRQIQNLSQKGYWKNLEQTPDFVVMFLPGESFFSAALQVDPELIEYGANNKVIIATPTTLIALLRSVAYGWRQEAITKNALEISKLGQELYKRISKFSSYVQELGKQIKLSVSSYNKMVGTLESRVLSTARRFEGLGLADVQVDDKALIVEEVDLLTREIKSLESDINCESADDEKLRSEIDIEKIKDGDQATKVAG